MIELQPFGREDFARLIQWASSPELVLQWSGGGFTYPLDEQQLERYLQGAENDPPLRKIYCAVDAGAVVGHIELNNITWTHRSASIARVLVGDPAARGKGYGEQMMRKIMQLGFEELGLHRLELNVYDFNEPAIRLYEKLGFVKEGLMRETRWINGVFWSHYHMSMLEHEWRARKA